MEIRYSQNRDILTIILGSPAGDVYELEADNFVAFVDDEDGLNKIVIKDARKFLADAVAIADAPLKPPSELIKPVWEDVDSSMISAFKYDEAGETLDVMFTRTGLYRYFDVPPDVVEGLRKASSKGSYMRYEIIDFYNYENRGR